MRYTFHAEQWLPYSVDTLFAFFADPTNLPRLMPAWQKARIDEASILPPSPAPGSTPSTIAAGVGSRITLSFRAFPYSPIRISWDAKIVDFLWNERFCDRQLRGPFAYWNHCHSVRTETRNTIPGTLITDHVEYELPFGRLGELAHAIALRRQIAYMFTYRQTRLAEIFPT